MEVNSEVKKHTGVTVQESKDEDCPRKSEKDFMILSSKLESSDEYKKKETNSNIFLGNEGLWDIATQNQVFQFILP